MDNKLESCGYVKWSCLNGVGDSNKGPLDLQCFAFFNKENIDFII